MTSRVARRLIRPVRVRTLLLFAVLVPLTAAMYFVVDDVTNHRAVEAEANRIEEAAVGAQHLLNARAALDSELRASDALSVVSNVDFDIVPFIESLGIDVGAQLGPPRGTLDSEIDNIRALPPDMWADPTAVEAFLHAAESIPDHRVLLDSFTITAEDVADIRQRLSDPLDQATQAQIRSLGSVDDLVPGAGRLVELASTASDSAAYVDAVQLQTAELITANIPLGGDGTQLASLRTSIDLADAAWETLASRLDPERRLIVAELRAHPDVVQLTTESEAVLANGPDPFAFDAAITAIDLAVSVGDTLSQITDGVITDLGAEAARISDEAAADRRQSLTVGFFIGVTTLVLLAIAVSMIVRPLRFLEGRARRISDGVLAPADGRLVLREAAVIDEAMDHMAKNLTVIEQQAEALSNGRLDSSSLEVAAPGRLGDSLRQSVDRLTELTSRLDHQARHDPLTGLPNRAAAMAAIEDALERRRRRGGHLALLFVDLDEFKRVNDDHGHSAGDAVLIETAARLVEQTRGRDFVARLGGDEFIVIIDDLESRRTAVATAERIGAAMAVPMRIGEVSITTTASIGLGWTDDAVRSGEELLHRADLAVYQSKALGKARVEVFDDDIQHAADHRRDVEGGLQAALDRGELELWYQPIVTLPDGGVWGFEALLRWRNADGTIRLPDEFIPIAEQSNLIVNVDRWVIEAALSTMRTWQDDPATSDLNLAINVSTRHMASGDIVEELDTAAAGVDISKLSVAITETGLLDDLAAASETVSRLSDLGVGVAIDDFGTGHSSVARLRGLPVDRVKVDRSYIQETVDSSDRSIMAILASLGDALGLEVVAEGIETDANHELAVSFAYTHAQGHLYAPAMPADEVRAWLATDRAPRTSANSR